MGDETHELQKDPPEGSRKVIERELERQRSDSGGGPGGTDRQGESGKRPEERSGGEGSR